MEFQRTYKIALGLIELFFAIPILGGAIILANSWIPLILLVILHAMGTYYANENGKRKIGHILGIVGNIIAFIPVIGWLVHVIVGVTLLIHGITDK